MDGYGVSWALLSAQTMIATVTNKRAPLDVLSLEGLSVRYIGIKKGRGKLVSLSRVY